MEQRGSDLRVSVEITLDQAASGVEKEIKYQHYDECSRALVVERHQDRER